MFRRLVTIAIVSIAFTGAAYAQAGDAPFNGALAQEIARAEWAQSRNLRYSASPLRIEPLTLPSLKAHPASTYLSGAAAQASERSWGWKVLGGAIGAVGGFFAGGYLGAWLEPDCHCDDPGFKGALIGAPIGAVVGGIVGVKVF